jgi:DNA-binding MarR family transcriptional regulator
MNVAPAATPPGDRPGEVDDPRVRLGGSFKATMGAVRRLRGRETQHPDKLSYAQSSLLFGLAAEAQLSASKLASVADRSPAMATEMLDHLEAQGLVRRTRSEHNKRVVLVSLTRRGRVLVQRWRANLERRRLEALADFDDQQLADARVVLDRLREFFDGLQPD